MAVAKSVLVSNKHPWIMYHLWMYKITEFSNPLERESHYVRLSGIKYRLVCYCKDRWLLLYSLYTQKAVELPQMDFPSKLAAFSAAPNTLGCIVIALMQLQPHVIAISTYRPGDEAWTVNHFKNAEPFVSSNPNQWTFCNGRFYCLSQSGQLGCYDPDNSAWSVLPLERPECIRANPLD
ncbi:F-box/kelch-repeat protein At1g57790-like [Andrographis paniculata]|uniref:F-box/kelch-repeat protein At1g57790-like n=1 Tax=Andrographis paniculata TaxID=175694 RepID=UPI0021E8EEA3|nr:F-box/kelch-repeat protein At1g57790-like [Andrographis paniculata]